MIRVAVSSFLSRKVRVVGQHDVCLFIKCDDYCLSLAQIEPGMNHESRLYCASARNTRQLAFAQNILLFFCYFGLSPGKIRSRRDGTICYLLVGNKYRLGDALLSIERPFRGLHTIILSLRDGSFLAYLSGHFVPGYLHLVPTGHRRFVFQSGSCSCRTRLQ
jgi:hypothetical protein